MSKKNKCNGLDCAICAETKCPNEKIIINGIDVSEYFTNHYDNLGKLYAVEYKGNPLELQNAIKRLQQELDIKEKMLDKFMIGSGETLEKLQKENEELKEKAPMKLIAKNNKYRSALEEIKEHINGLEKLLFENIYADDTKRLIMVELQKMWKTNNYNGEQVWYSEEDVKPFFDPYFKGLDFKTIAELAKKSIRITADNCRLEHKLEDIIDFCESYSGTQPDVIAVLKVIKYRAEKE